MNESDERKRARGRRGGNRRADASLRVWRLDLAYEGTDYRGWARQPGLRTVEGDARGGPGDDRCASPCA